MNAYISCLLYSFGVTENYCYKSHYQGDSFNLEKFGSNRFMNGRRFSKVFLNLVAGPSITMDAVLCP